MARAAGDALRRASLGGRPAYFRNDDAPVDDLPEYLAVDVLRLIPEPRFPGGQVPEDPGGPAGPVRQHLPHATQTSWSTRIFRDMPAGEAWLQDEYQEVYGEALGDIVHGAIVVPEVGGAHT